MFIDINTYVGHWPFHKLSYNTLEGLDTLAQEYDVTHMVVSNLNALHYKDANEANYELLEELKSYNGKTQFIPLAFVNPTYPGWERNARKMIELGFCGFELAPLYHRYSLAPEMLYDMYNPVHRAGKVMELAEELGVPVRICASFENFRGRSDLDTPDVLKGDDYFALASKYRNVPILATSISPANLGEKLTNLLREYNNIYFDTTQVPIFLTFVREKIKSTIPEECLCFGSLSPLMYMETNLIRIEFAKGFDSEKIKENGARAFKNL